MTRKNNQRTDETAEEPLGQNDQPPGRGSEAKGKKKFVEPTVSVPVDVFKATTFFLALATEPPP